MISMDGMGKRPGTYVISIYEREEERLGTYVIGMRGSGRTRPLGEWSNGICRICGGARTD